MRVVFGLKPHSGWAALVVLGKQRDDLHVVDRRRIELVKTDEAEWAKQPYHAAEGLNDRDARNIVKRAIRSAERHSVREMRAAVKRARDGKHSVAACAVLMSDPMPDWSVEEVLAVHFRMHKAEGVLFREALARAATICGLNLVAILEKQLQEYATKILAVPLNRVAKRIEALGKSVGAPWGKDQKEACLAAMVAFARPSDVRVFQQ